MKIYKSTYKNVFSIVIETEKLTAVVCPSEGGKFVSIKSKNREFLVQNPSSEFLHLSYDGEFEKTECAGFDDMFPTIDPVIVKEGSRKGKEYNDHGEVCRLSFDYEIKDNAVYLKTTSKNLNYTFEKVITADDNGGILVNYKVVNLSSDNFNCLWAGHCLVDITSGGEILTPFSDGDEYDLVYDPFSRIASSLGRLKLDSKKVLDFSGEEDKTCYKLYFPKKLNGGAVAFKFLDGETFSIEFSKEIPYLGIWVNNGYLNNQRNVGLEPCTLGYDTIYNAEKYNQNYKIGANEAKTFSIKISVL